MCSALTFARTPQIGLHRTGSIRLLEKGNADRLTEAKQHVAMAALYDDPGLPTTLISAAEVAALHPLVDVSTVEAGIYTTQDGDVCPTLLTTCLAKLAQADGASIVHNAEVDTVTRQPNGTFTVSTVNGALYQADAVVNAAGLWSRKFSRQLGLEDTHPALVIEHQYAITETIPALKGKVRNDGRGVPCTARSRGRSRGRAPPWPSSSRPLILHLPSNPPLDRRCATASACHACAT